MLKKEFKRKDVNRARNLIRGKTNESTNTQIGYTKKRIDYKEGDVWIEDKKTWTIKNGIKQTVSKLDVIKKESFMTLSCPNCNKVMKKRLDKPNYRIHKKCHDCVVKFETQLRVKGLWEEYEKSIINNDIDAFLIDYENRADEILNKHNNTTTYFTEHGYKETWKGGKSKKEIKEELDKGREEIENIKK